MVQYCDTGLVRLNMGVLMIKTGFVSNSSSSSFVVSAKNGVDVMKLVMTLDLNSFCDRVIRTEDDLRAYIEEESLDEDDGPAIESMLEAIHRGDTVYIGWCSNDDGAGISEFIFYNGLGSHLVDDDVRVITEPDR